MRSLRRWVGERDRIPPDVPDVPGDPARRDTAPIASEFVGTSLSADARPQEYYSALQPENPHLHQLRSDQRGYALLDFHRERLEAKLRHKNTQIARTERLLETLPEAQKPAFEALLNQAVQDRDRIQEELDQLYRILDELKGRGEN